MFGIGFTELILIAIVALIFIGPEKLPEIAKTLGKAYTEIRRAGNEVKRSVADEAKATGVGDAVASVGREVKAASGAVDAADNAAKGVAKEGAADGKGAAGAAGKGPAAT